MLSHSAVSDSFQPYELQLTMLLCPEDSQARIWSGLPSPPPGNLPTPGIKPTSPANPALTGGFFTSEPAGKPLFMKYRVGHRKTKD